MKFLKRLAFCLALSFNCALVATHLWVGLIEIILIYAWLLKGMFETCE